MEKPLDPDAYQDVAIDDPENPEWTDEDFARARPFKEVFPDLYERIVSEGVGVAPEVKKAS